MNDKILTKQWIIVSVLFVSALVLSPFSVAHSLSEISENHDCTVVELSQIDDPTLTQAEKIALMDAALLESIDHYDECISNTISRNVAQGQGNGAGGAGSQGNGGNGGADGQENGLSQEGESQQANGSSNTEGNGQQANESNHQSNTTNDRLANGGGAKNQEIAPKDNDAAICTILAEELALETDPQKQQELKEIYRSYRCRS